MDKEKTLDLLGRITERLGQIDEVAGDNARASGLALNGRGHFQYSNGNHVGPYEVLKDSVKMSDAHERIETLCGIIIRDMQDYDIDEDDSAP